MKRRFVVLAVSACFLAGCAVAPRNVAVTNALPKNPCFDPVYVELSAMPVETMTERQYELYLEKERACAEFREADLVTNAQRDRNTILGLFLGAIVAVSAVGLIIANGE